jgi:cytoskeletal protein CcmA (bactofilin family)
VDGDVTAGSLLVERGADVIFVQGVKARTVEIYGRVTGRVEAAGNVVLHRGAELCGNCYAPMLIVRPGATHRGGWQKISPADAELPLLDELPPES